MNATPSPAIMARFAPAAIAVIPPTLPVEGVHDGVVKTKHLEHGMKATPYFNGEAKGAERTIDRVERATQDGSMWTIHFLSPHAPQTEKAAYRWFVPELAGQPVDGPTIHLTQTIGEAVR